MNSVSTNTRFNPAVNLAATGLCAFILSAVLAGQAVAQPDRAAPDWRDPGAAAVSADGQIEPLKSFLDHARPFDRPATDRARSFARFVSTNEDPEGDMPRDVVITPDGTAAVIVNRDTDNLTFFNVNTRTITHTVAVGDYPIHVAVTPDGRYALSPNVFSNTVSVVDIATHTVAAHVPITGDQPYRVAVTDDGDYAVVGVINDAITSAFSIIDLNTLAEIRSFPTSSQGVFGFFFTPESGINGEITTQFAVSSDNTTVVLPDRFNSRVKLYDLNTGGELASLATPALPTAVDIHSAGATAVVSHEGANRRITKIDIPSLSVTGTFTTASDLFDQRIRITPDGSHAMAPILNNVIFVNLASGTTTATLSTGTVGDIEFSADGQFAFISNFNARVISLATQSIVATMPFAACAEAATSPTQNRAVALNNRFREDIQVYTINGGASSFEGFAASGSLPEADAQRTVAMSPDGNTVIVGNNVSRNVSILDLVTRDVRAHVDTGDRVTGLAVTPDASHAVVVNTEVNTVSIIDLSTDTRVANLTAGTRPAEVRVSPDSQFAYVTSIAGADQLHFIRLAGSGSTLLSSINTGQMGSINYTYGVFSGIELSPDGSTLVLCISFDDQLMIVNTATRTEVARLAVGDFPIRAAFTPGGNRAYIANSFSNNVTVVNIAGGSSSVIATVPGITFPLTVNVDATGAYVYVASWDNSVPSFKVISTATNTVVATVPLPAAARATHLSPPDALSADPILHAALTNGSLARVRATGTTSALIDTTPLSGGPSDLAYSELRNTALIAQPVPDGVDLFITLQPGDTNCDGSINAFDIQPFIDALSDPAGYQQAYPNCDIEHADLNGDGSVNAFDIQGFVECLNGSCP